ncbi:MAG: sulfite oxidase-like oxidoreductase [Caldisericales bacterium]|jgi:DMSO/TMAO reductase YedYZ molybdopterin-dependent catalytic subunit|nr:sulfite oxidase-like oxidoreductase [bacterium]
MEQKKVVISPDTKRDKRIPPGQSETTSFPVLHYGQMPTVDIEKWRFSIFGLVEEGKSFSYEEFSGLPMTEVRCDIHCVTGWSRLDNVFEGVSALVIRDLVKIRPEAKFVMIHGHNDFTTNIPLHDFFQDDVVFALKFNGEPISLDHGFPVRLVVPRLYFWKSAKWVTGLEFIPRNKLGFWESYGYHEHGDPWKEERYGY